MFDKHFIGQNAAGITAAPQFAPISKVVLLVDDERSYVAGDGTGREIELTCPYGSQDMADDLLSRLRGYAYRPMTAQDALLDPAAELGDGVTVGGVYTVLAEMDTLFDMHCAADIAAPGEDEVDSEYKYQTPEKRLERQLAYTRSLITKTAEEIGLKVEGVDGRVTSLSLDLDGVSAEVRGLEDEFVALALTVDGVTITDSSGTTRIRGSSIDVSTLNVHDINFSGVISFGDLSGTDEVAMFDDIPTHTSDLVNDSGFQTKKQVTVITEDAISTATITANQITSGTITAGKLSMKGVLQLDFGSLPYGYVGASNAGDYTGAVLCDDTQTNYFIATRGGARMTAGDSDSIYVIDGGCYSTSAMQVASDRRLKKNICYDLSQEERFFSLLRPCSFEMIKDKAGKRRWGIIAQDAIAAAESVGMDPFKLGLIGQDNGMYSVGYSEMTPINTYMIQLLMSRMDRLEAAYGI